MAFQTATFVVLYLHARLVLNLKKPRNVIILVPTIQLAFTSLAFWLALTRVKDHMHHPGDVIAGALIGTGIQVRRKSYKPFYLPILIMTTAFSFSPFFSDMQRLLQFTTVSRARYQRRMDGETTTLV